MDKHIAIVFNRWTCHILNCDSKKLISTIDYQFSPVQSLSHIWLFRAPWTTAYQASRSRTNYWSLLILMSIELVIPSNHLILLLLPSIFSHHESFPVSQFFTSGGQSIGVSASASVLPVYIQDWFPLGQTNLISLLSKGYSRVFSNTMVQKHRFFGTQLSL